MSDGIMRMRKTCDNPFETTLQLCPGSTADLFRFNYASVWILNSHTTTTIAKTE